MTLFLSNVICRLDMEEHLLREHFMKYNLRFYWKSAERENACFEDYSQAYLRTFSNVATYQLDRNKLEAEFLRLNSQNSQFTFCASVVDLEVALLVILRAKGTDFDWCQGGELTGQILHMDPSAAIDMRWILICQQKNTPLHGPLPLPPAREC